MLFELPYAYEAVIDAATTPTYPASLFAAQNLRDEVVYICPEGSDAVFPATITGAFGERSADGVVVTIAYRVAAGMDPANIAAYRATAPLSSFAEWADAA
jgi:hypothetical protein